MESTTLVTRDSKGKIRVAEVSYEWSEPVHGFLIHRKTSQYGGKITIQPDKVILRGKVKRTVTEQCKLEYNSIIKKYLDKGYKQLNKPIEKYTVDELNEFIGEVVTSQDGTIKPMLAKQADKVTNRKIFDKEWYASRKIDGLRVLFYLGEDGIIHTTSRGGHTYDYSTDHLREHPKLIEWFNKHPRIILDSELYKHGKSLQQINSAARLEVNAYDCDWLEMYLYDLIDLDNLNLTFKDRLDILNSIEEELSLSFEPYRQWNEGDLQIQMVPHVKVSGWNSIMNLHNQYVNEGFEGVVIRNPDKPYKPNGRSNDMIKIKKYLDDTYKVIGYELGLRGSEDMVFICEMNDGRTFKAQPVGDRLTKQEYVDNFEEKYKGHVGDCKYFYLSDDSIPLQPHFLRFRPDLE